MFLSESTIEKSTHDQLKRATEGSWGNLGPVSQRPLKNSPLELLTQTIPPKILLTWNPRMEVWFRCFSFSKWWFLGSIWKKWGVVSSLWTPGVQVWRQVSTQIMAGPPTPPNLPPPINMALWSGLINHWFPLIRPAIKALWIWWGGRLTSHKTDFSAPNHKIPKQIVSQQNLFVVKRHLPRLHSKRRSWTVHVSKNIHGISITRHSMYGVFT